VVLVGVPEESHRTVVDYMMPSIRPAAVEQYTQIGINISQLRCYNDEISV
jgi:hypothetical protein